jgi:branched-chain amino acid transport system ATP-binding protein
VVQTEEQAVIDPLQHQPLLDIIGLTHSFGGLRAVSRFNLTVANNSRCGIIGPNGAGKTTVFNLITGVYRPDEGKIMLNGCDCAGMPSHAIIARGISRTFQNIRLFKSMTVAENMITAGFSGASYSLADALMRLPRFRREEEKLRNRAGEILSAFGLIDRADEPAVSLSYGMQRKVEIARALMSQPSVLLLDEPGAGMNPAELDGLIELVEWVREKFRVAIVLIEHRMRLVRTLCDLVNVLHFGETIFTGKPDDLMNNESVVKAYFGDAHAASGR